MRSFKYSSIFLLLLIFSCKTLIEEETIESKVYFFEPKSMTSIQLMECSNMISDKTLGLRVIDSIPKQLVKKIQISIAEGSFNGNIPDVRYRVEVGQEVICLDYRGQFITKKMLQVVLNTLLN